MDQQHPLIGRRVLNVHRQGSDYSQASRDAHNGIIIKVEEGCNPVVHVQFDGLEFPSVMSPLDLAFCELWPSEGCRVIDSLRGEATSFAGVAQRQSCRP